MFDPPDMVPFTKIDEKERTAPNIARMLAGSPMNPWSS